MPMRIPYLGQLTCDSFYLLALLVLAGPPSVAAQQANNTNANAGQGLVDSLSFAGRDDPIDIRSQSLEFLFEEKRVRYRDKVVATQGDVRLTCNLLTVIYEDQKAQEDQAQHTGHKSTQQTSPQLHATSATADQRLKEVIAEGNVKVTTENGYATGKKLVFNDTKRTVILSGDAVLHEGVNQVSGDRVIVYLDEKRSVVEGRARMQFVPQSKTHKGAASK
jgi:lipopolysaccharide export system protein LptA